MDDRVGDLVGISGRFAAGTCHLPHPRRPEQGLSARDRSGDTDAHFVAFGADYSFYVIGSLLESHRSLTLLIFDLSKSSLRLVLSVSEIPTIWRIS